MPDPPSYSEMRKRLAALHDRGDVPADVSPMSAASPGQVDAMQESMDILSDPVMMRRVQMGRQAVMRGDIVPLGGLLGEAAEAASPFAVVVTRPVVTLLREQDEAAASAILYMISGLRATPAEQGRPLGMGLVGVYSSRGETYRLLYAVHRAKRLVTILSVDGDERPG